MLFSNLSLFFELRNINRDVLDIINPRKHAVFQTLKGLLELVHLFLELDKQVYHHCEQNLGFLDEHLCVISKPKTPLTDHFY